jgi:L-asparaginase / beta-aspartyl-peptidase
MRPLLGLALALALSVAASAQPSETPVALAIHGGAGVIERGSMTPELEAAYRQAIEDALRAGYAVLAGGGSALDAVVAAVLPLEDSDLFNAGRGAVLTAEGAAELDASIMDGATLDAGAIAGVRHVRNPIRAARYVMERSPHVMLAGTGADTFAEAQGLEPVENAYFLTERRREALRRVQERERSSQPTGAREAHERMGTVGAVALDRQGRLAAATSTGGTTNKRFGRVGDSPVIGAGTYADAGCAVSATGTGEYFIRLAVAYAICARMRYLNDPVHAAAAAVVHGDLTALGGDGGVIAMDGAGRVAMPFNTPGMFRGQVDADGNVSVEIYRD